ncbi:hypothetical protein KCP75_14705 [Salmonella enterica subsp. enterica]|nr:hypothetical protein KCP75_14705 [Salmonella enterica subsp. enterica]
MRPHSILPVKVFYGEHIAPVRYARLARSCGTPHSCCPRLITAAGVRRKLSRAGDGGKNGRERRLMRRQTIMNA